MIFVPRRGRDLFEIIEMDKKENLFNINIDQWEFVEKSLRIQEKGVEELIPLFDITPSALSNWKKGKNISQDKLVILANMFGITIDEMYEGVLNDDYLNEYCYGLKKYSNKEEFKSFSLFDLEWMFENINKALFYIEHYPLGYYETKPEATDPIDYPNKFYIDSADVKYFCDNFDINIIYSTKEKKEIEIKSISFDELNKVKSKLNNDWKDDSYKYISAKADNKYDNIVLLSENTEFLKKYISDNHNLKNDYLKRWQRLKKEDSNFDLKNIMAKILLANGAMVEKDGKEDVNETLNLYKYLIEIDVNNLQ